MASRRPTSSLRRRASPRSSKRFGPRPRRLTKVLLATDPDREGEAIAYHLMEVAKKANKGAEIKRVLFEEITKRGVKEGPRAIPATSIQTSTRRSAPAASSTASAAIRFRASCGRSSHSAYRQAACRPLRFASSSTVSTSATRSFPVDYWLVDARLKGEKPQSRSWPRMQSVDGEKLEKVGSRLCGTQREADAERSTSPTSKSGGTTKSKGITKRKASRKAPAPYTTSKLQQDSANRLSMPPKRTMRIAQQLYEGITLGRGKNSETVGSDHLHAYRQHASVARRGERVPRLHRQEVRQGFAIPEKPNFFKSKKQNVQDAHEAIRPTRVSTSRRRPSASTSKIRSASSTSSFGIVSWLRR